MNPDYLYRTRYLSGIFGALSILLIVPVEILTHALETTIYDTPIAYMLAILPYNVLPIVNLILFVISPVFLGCFLLMFFRKPWNNPEPVWGIVTGAGALNVWCCIVLALEIMGMAPLSSVLKFHSVVRLVLTGFGFFALLLFELAAIKAILETLRSVLSLSNI